MRAVGARARVRVRGPALTCVRVSGRFDQNELREGFNIYLLMQQLADGDESGDLERAVITDAFPPYDRVAAMFYQARRFVCCFWDGRELGSACVDVSE